MDQEVEVVVGNTPLRLDLMDFALGSVLEIVTGGSRWYVTITELIKEAPPVDGHVLVKGVMVQPASENFARIPDGPKETLFSRFLSKDIIAHYGLSGVLLGHTGHVRMVLDGRSRQLL